MFGVDSVALFPSLVFLDYISPFNICCKAGLVVLNCLNVCFSEKLLISPSILKEILAGYSNLGCRFFPFSTTNRALQQMLRGLYSQEIQEKKKDLQNQPQTIKKMAIGTYISIITLNVNGLNAPTKRHRLAEWIKKQDPYICCQQETHFRPKDTYRLEVRG